MKSYCLLSLGLFCSIGLTSCRSVQKREEIVEAEVTRSGNHGAHSSNLRYFSDYVTRDQSVEEIFNGLIQKGLVVVDFYADWCGPCKRLGGAFETIAPDYADVLIIKVDVDTYKQLAQLYAVRSMPTILFFKDGSLVHKVTGFEGQGPLKALLNKWR